MLVPDPVVCTWPKEKTPCPLAAHSSLGTLSHISDTQSPLRRLFVWLGS